MEITDDLIRKFLNNECGAEEAHTVHQFLTLHPERMDPFLSAHEWDDTEQTEELHGNLSKKMLHELRQKLIFRPQPVMWWKTKTVTRITVLAVLVLLAMNIWVLYRPSGHKELIDESKALKASEKAAPASAKKSEWITDKNSTSSVKKIWLPDNSVVLLHPRSSIQYKAHFDTGRRDIYLSGQAFFEVTKNKEKPFSVYSGPLSTTALGTSFSVSASPGTYTSVAVQLFTGKVVIRSIKPINGWHSDIHLLPGQMLEYDEKLMQATVSEFGKHKKVNRQKQPAVPRDLEFNNTSLTEVFDQLQNNYHTSIQYSRKDISGLNFTGTVLKTDSLAVILKLLTTMNGLNLKEEKGSFIIYHP